MKKLSYTFLIAGAIALAFGLLAWILPGVTISQFTLGFFFGIGSTLIVGGLIIMALPFFCKKKEVEIKK